MAPPKRSHYFALLFALFALVLLIFANLGITNTSSFLPKIFIVQASQTKTNQSIRYGFYRSCIFKGDSDQPDTCNDSNLLYTFDVDQLAKINNLNLDSSDVIKQAVQQYSQGVLNAQKATVLVLPSAILAFIGMIIAMMMRRMRKNNMLPTLGALSGLLGAVCSGMAIGFAVVLYRSAFEQISAKVDGLTYHWGPAVYIVGAACGCQVITFIWFIASCFARLRIGKEHDHTYEYYERHSFSSVSMHQHRY